MVRLRSREGFSLIEMMVVVMIIGGMAAMVMPALSEYLADTRASTAAEDLVRLSRRIRSRVEETGLAHYMAFDSTGSNGLGTVTVWEGMNNHCSQTPWTIAIGRYTTDPSFAPIEVLDMGYYNSTTIVLTHPPRSTDQGRYVIQAWAAQETSATVGTDDTGIASKSITSSPLTTVGICYQPNGQTFQGGPTTFTPQLLPYTFWIVRRMNGNPRGIVRHVIFSPGGTARAQL